MNAVLRTWYDKDDEPGADVLAVVDDTCMFWVHRGGEYPWWCGYGVTWEYLRQRGPLRQVGSFALLRPSSEDCRSLAAALLAAADASEATA